MPKLGLGLSLPQTIVAGSSFDPDALSYIAAVAVADGQDLESGVKTAINTFVVGCKADGIWDAIVASCIMAGARTVAGAIVPLKGNAPTNNNFVIGDYSRKLGLLGNDTDKYLATGYNNNDTTNFPQNDSHISCYVSASQTDTAGILVGGINIGSGNRISLHYATATQISTRNRGATASTISQAPIGFQGNTRNNSADFSRRFTTSGGASDSVFTSASGTPISDSLGVFAAGNGSNLSNARMSFYSIGKSLTLSSLDSRVTTLMNTLASVLP
jgi:hypothetical protein